MGTQQKQVQVLTVVDIRQEINTAGAGYANSALALVNDHIVRLSVMTAPYFWHLHPNSDESFFVLEGSVIIELEDSTIELLPHQLFTIPRNVKHRTRPGGVRSVNLSFESEDMDTVRLES